MHTAVGRTSSAYYSGPVQEPLGTSGFSSCWACIHSSAYAERVVVFATRRASFFKFFSPLAAVLVRRSAATTFEFLSGSKQHGDGSATGGPNQLKTARGSSAAGCTSDASCRLDCARVTWLQQRILTPAAAQRGETAAVLRQRRTKKLSPSRTSGGSDCTARYLLPVLVAPSDMTAEITASVHRSAKPW
ncbi:unnamed protein product [Cuscuta campestris]|uniref:Uncharacterized protein n=1 Tax=Cuscuta campestris TaxID=132261 RepID=A0A484LR19_9ASTE|nr:unnamed protein product [Cuscuta campestris]